MNLKKILCVCLALVLALAVSGCSDSKDVKAQLEAANATATDLQAQLDDANAKTADLQAQLDDANAKIAELEAAPAAAEPATDAQEPATDAEDASADAEEPATDSDAEAKIAELQALVDTYYPYYAAQIVATYGEDGIVWLSEVQNAYDSVSAQYAAYGLDLAAYGMEDSVKKDLVDSAVRDGVIKAKATELGLDQFDEDTIAEFEASADAVMENYISTYIDHFYPDAEEVTDEMRAEAEAYWSDNGLTRDIYVASLKSDATNQAVHDYITKDVAITDEDVQAEYETLISENQSSYTNDRTYNSDRNAGTVIAWNPEGYRAVKHVLVKFSDEQAQLYSDLQSQLDSLNAEKEALEAPEAEATEAPEAEPADTEAPEDEADSSEAKAETVEPAAEDAADEAEAPARSIEEINADIAACATELEALYAQLMPTAEEVVAAFETGASFDELIEKYNEDPGMQTEPTATIGYAVSATSDAWDPAFTEGAMSIAEVGQISAPVRGANGIHIIYYMSDITPGEVPLEEIREGVEEVALSDKIQATYDDQVAAWVAEANVEYFYSNFGIAE